MNTTTASMENQKHNLAIYQSVGISPKALNRVVKLESPLYGIKALLWGLPIGWLISIVFYYFLSQNVVLPWLETLISILAILLITATTMNMAVRKIEKENVIDMLRKESI
ncbi:ABC transporter permease [Bacillaceae bacterium Marseille-Q3522]|nr:ABC transporter permease [Bacillaceae bacterium Marseille-Q3522]